MNITRRFLPVAIAALAAVACSARAGDFPEGSPKFVMSYTAALESAAKEGKPAILVFSASWCPPCQANKKKVYPDAAVKPLHEKFVWAYLDADDAANEKPMKEYGVNGIPHIQFLDKNGKTVSKLIGGTTPEAFVKELEGVLKKTAATTDSGADSEKAKETAKEAGAAKKEG